MKLIWAALLVGVLGIPVNVYSKDLTRITVIGQRVGDNDRNAYQEQLLRLALAKTEPTHGPFEVVHGPKMIRSRRAHILLSENTLHNYVRPLVFDKEFANDKSLSYIEFPIYLGLLSYRVCFTHAKHVNALAKVKHLEELLPFRHILGTGWLDVDILRYNGLDVVESTNYSAMFRMVAMGRADLFCRGLNEVQREYQENRDVLNLVLLEGLGLHYPLPIYFFSSRQNKAVLDRINTGIQIAYQDKSLEQLWRKYYIQSISFAKLSSRKIIYLQNPGLAGLHDAYSKYFYRPQ